MNRYTVTIFWSAEDACWVAVCPAFVGLSAFGDTPAAALAEVQTAIALTLATYAAEGWPVPDPALGRVPPTVAGRIAALEAEADRLRHRPAGQPR